MAAHLIPRIPEIGPVHAKEFVFVVAGQALAARASEILGLYTASVVLLVAAACRQSGPHRWMLRAAESDQTALDAASEPSLGRFGA